MHSFMIQSYTVSMKKIIYYINFQVSYYFEVIIHADIVKSQKFMQFSPKSSV